MVQVTEKQIKENGLTEFRNLIEEVSKLSKDKREKVCMYIQGFIARDLMDKHKSVS